MVLGIDLGVSALMTAFDGTEFDEEPAPRPLRKAMKRLRRAQRSFSRRKKGSARRPAAARKVQAIHRRVRHLRKEVLHQLSHRLTAKAGVLKVETLHVRGMAQNRGIALLVQDAGMSRLLDLIATKADWRRREVIRIDRWFPGSQTCCRCKAPHPEMRTKRREWMICSCGTRMHRDRNAAVNHFTYPQGAGKGVALGGPTRVETGDQAEGASPAPVPVVDARTTAGVDHVLDRECQ